LQVPEDSVARMVTRTTENVLIVEENDGSPEGTWLLATGRDSLNVNKIFLDSATGFQCVKASLHDAGQV
jgi:hypothetical protein